MKQYAAWIVAAALCAGAAARTCAQEAPKEEPKRPSPEEAFKKMDTNGDGQISLDEFKASMAERAKSRGREMPADMVEKRFKAMDTDANGTVSLEEFKKAPRPGTRGPRGEEAPKAPEAKPAAVNPPPAVAPVAAPAAQ